MRNTITLLALAAVAAPAWAAPASLNDLDWLKGQWVAVGQGADNGKGHLTFEGAAGGQVIMSKNVVDYPATGGRPAQHRRQLMVFYREAGGLRAIVWDNDGQTKHYAVTAPAKDDLVLISDDPTGPKMRVTYHRSATGLDGSVEMAAPPARDQFKPFLSWKAEKRAP
jgi:hypothetical protein